MECEKCQAHRNITRKQLKGLSDLALREGGSDEQYKVEKELP